MEECLALPIQSASAVGLIRLDTSHTRKISRKDGLPQGRRWLLTCVGNRHARPKACTKTIYGAHCCSQGCIRACADDGTRIAAVQPSDHPSDDLYIEQDQSACHSSASLYQTDHQMDSDAYVSALKHCGDSCKDHQMDSGAYVSALQHCGNSQDLSNGWLVHAQIVESGQEQHVYLGNQIMQMYLKCAELDEAQSMFNRIIAKNEFSWTILIGAFARYDKRKEALLLFQQLQLENIKPDKVTCITMLSICASEGSLLEGLNMYFYIVSNGLEYDITVVNAVVNMYSRCGCLEDAERLFGKMSRRNVVSWNGILTAYAQHGKGKEALQVYNAMQLQGEAPNMVTLVGALSACANQVDLDEGRRIHDTIMKKGLDFDGVVGNALVNMYSKCNSLQDACNVFEKMEQRDIVSWNAIIGAHAQQGRSDIAFSLFFQMNLEGLVPDKVTFISLLDSCAENRLLDEGKQVHACIVEYGLHSDTVVMTALINMYSKCGGLDEAHSLFDGLLLRDVVSWNAMITAYAQHDQSKEALRIFDQMRLEGVNPDTFTYVGILDACASLPYLAEGKRIHTTIINSGCKMNSVVQTALLNMYGKCGSLENAKMVFGSISVQNAVPWNALIAAYGQHGRGQEALQFFQQMQADGIPPNQGTFVSLLDACGSLMSLREGKDIHKLVVESGLEGDSVVGTALVTMYGKCGSLKDALRLFNKLVEYTLVTWTSMITLCSQHGHAKKALKIFEQMKLEGFTPNEASYTSILSACSHSGLVDEGRHFFHSMSQDDGIIPSVDHYNCIIDLLARAGYLREAEDLIDSMPFLPNVTSWITLLSACRNSLDIERGERSAEKILQMNPYNDAAYVLLSNMYAATGRWDDAAKIRDWMESMGVKKQPGCSSIEVNNQVHKFFAGGVNHPQKEEIYAELQKLSRLLKDGGYTPQTEAVLHDVTEEEKETLLLHHSEKLAIAYGLLTTDHNTPLFIVKNLRTCPDCHSVAKAISKICQREIILRDIKCFHHFKGGTCSCADYW